VTTEHIRFRGTVQGVGFRPTVARLARARGLQGWVRNDGDGVLVALTGEDAGRDAFVEALLSELPPLARVDKVERAPADPTETDGFDILDSVASRANTEVVPDAATCPACSAEINDPFSRRYRYPFTNCTHCGPRFSIVLDLPYDRGATTMAGFGMCEDCRREYEDETDRRYHAQPIACGRCGPKAELARTDGSPVSFATYSMLDDVDAVRTLLLRGEIVAVKGLGGYQLCCDATNELAVARLRRRKHRPHKPLALMAEKLETIARYAAVDALETEALQSPANPIVLLQAAGEALPPNVAPGTNQLGFMLPPTPLHQLMLRRIKRPIVCTSGNLTDEPQCTSDAEAAERLGHIADWMLRHDRPIAHRVDDSVVRQIGGEITVLRRARGLAPDAERLHPSFTRAPALTAMGGHLKTTFCLLDGDRAALSQHLGDLDDARTVADYATILDKLTRLYDHAPTRIVVDSHPGYRTRELAEAFELPIETVDHHHAHAASCMAEHGLPVDTDPVLAVVLDGLGMGPDGALWGGELLEADFRTATRLAALPDVPLLGGDRAAREPWRNTVAHLAETLGLAALDRVPSLHPRRSVLLRTALDRSTRASSTGRLFDAVAATLGLHADGITFEAQAAMALEALADDSRERWSMPLVDGRFDLAPMWKALLDGQCAGVPAATLAARFHETLAGALADAADTLRHDRPHLTTVVLSGGVWQNRRLTERTHDRLRASGWTVLRHRRVPANDGGLSLGQAAIAAARALE
jgi:hydrogenase maturation protein HypF